MNRKRYPDCIMEMSDCMVCSMMNYGRDCRNNPANNLAYLRHSTKMSQRSFSEYFNIPKRSIENWEGGQREAPAYLIDLIEYKLRSEGLIE